MAAADDASLANHAVVRLAAPRLLAQALVEKHELRRRQLRLVGPDRPFAVIEVEHRVDVHQVHVGLVVGVERTDVAPVGDGLAVLVAEAKGINPVGLDHVRNDVLAEIVIALRMRGVLAKQFVHQAGSENVNPHRGQTVLRIVRHRRRLARLLQKALDAVLVVDLHDAEVGAFAQRRGDAADGQIGLVVQVCLDHVAIVHFVNMVAGQDENVFRIGFLDAVNVLVNGVGRALVPVLVDALLGRQHVDVLLELAAEKTPAGGNVAVQAAGLVLGEHE